MWICPNCSNGNDDQAKFCTECGSPRPIPAPEAPWQNEPARVGDAPEQRDNWVSPPQQVDWEEPAQQADWDAPTIREPDPPGQPEEWDEPTVREPIRKPVQQAAWNPPAQQPAWNQPAQQPAWNQPAQQPPKKSKKGLVIGLIAGLSVVLVGLLVFLLLSLGGEARYREIRRTYSTWDGVNGEELTTYQGSSGRIDVYEDGSLVNYSTFTCNKDGYIQSELYYDADGTLVSRLEYEYDKHGNAIRIRRYTPEGNLDLLAERTFNDYRVMEQSVTTYYTEYGAVESKSVIEFSDTINGVSYDLDSQGERTDNFTYRRVYDKDNQLIEEWCYDASDGEMFRVNTYERDKNHYVTRYVTRFYDDDESIYTYEYERIK